jgi:nicotinamidase-related amidase
MATFPNRPNPALLVVDVQHDVVKAAHARDAVIANIVRLVDRARRANIAVIWVMQTDDDLSRGSDGWKLAAPLAAADDEPVVEKAFGDAFEQTVLEDELRRAAIGHLIIAGAQTDGCIRATIHGAFVRGYDVTLVTDAHTTEDFTSYGAPSPDLVIAHTNLIWKYETAPGRTAAAIPTAEVTFSG